MEVAHRLIADGTHLFGRMLLPFGRPDAVVRAKRHMLMAIRRVRILELHQTIVADATARVKGAPTLGVAAADIGLDLFAVVAFLAEGTQQTQIKINSAE